MKLNSFSFKCHRVDKDVYPINDVVFSPTFSTLASVGADGTYSIWNIERHTKIRSSESRWCEPAPAHARTRAHAR